MPNHWVRGGWITGDAPPFVSVDGTVKRPTAEELIHRDPGRDKTFTALGILIEEMGDVTVRVTKSQIAYRRDRVFAAIWVPSQYLNGNVAPLVLTLYLPYRIESSRWKQVVEPAPGRFTHHLELRGPADVDAEVAAWVEEAWRAAAPKTATDPARGRR